MLKFFDNGAVRFCYASFMMVVWFCWFIIGLTIWYALKWFCGWKDTMGSDDCAD